MNIRNLQWNFVRDGLDADMTKSLRQARDKSAGEDLAGMIPDGIIVLDVDGIIQYANPRAGGMLGSSPGSLVGAWFGIPAEGDGEVELEIAGAGRTAAVASMTCVRARWNGLPVYIASLRDVSGRTRSSDDLLHEKEAAVVRSVEKSAFLAELSHELRTPINAIVGLSDLMGTEIFGPLGSDKYREYVKDIRDSGLHLLQLLNSVLGLGKAEAGKMQLDVVSIDVAALASECMQLVSAGAEEKAIALRTTVPSLRLKVDPLKVKQILLNLLTNAVKFTGRGGTVDLRCALTRSGAVRVRVVDTGIGMGPDRLSDLFEPYRQVHRRKASAGAAGGTGLGLALTKQLVSLHDGTIRVTSAPGKGTSVTVVLPAARVVRPRAKPTVH